MKILFYYALLIGFAHAAKPKIWKKSPKTQVDKRQNKEKADDPIKPVATGHAQKFWNSEEKTKLTWRERKKLRQLQKKRENYFKVKLRMKRAHGKRHGNRRKDNDRNSDQERKRKRNTSEKERSKNKDRNRGSAYGKIRRLERRKFGPSQTRRHSSFSNSMASSYGSPRGGFGSSRIENQNPCFGSGMNRIGSSSFGIIGCGHGRFN